MQESKQEKPSPAKQQQQPQQQTQQQQQQQQQQSKQQPKQQQVDPQQKPQAKLEAPPPPAGSLQGPHTDIPHTQIRRIIASRLLESKQQIPHLYVSRKADMSAVTQLRQSMKQDNIKVWHLETPGDTA